MCVCRYFHDSRSCSQDTSPCVFSVSRTDALVQRSIRQCCTLIVIAHKLSTVFDSDKIVILQEGRKAEMVVLKEL